MVLFFKLNSLLKSFIFYNHITLTNYWLFIVFNKYSYCFDSLSIHKKLDINPYSNLAIKLKKRLCYFLILSDNTKKFHWAYKSLLIKKTLKFKSLYIFDFNFLVKQITSLFNLFITFLNRNYNFFIFNFDFLINDIYAFSKWIYGVKNIVKYDFIFKTDLKKFRNFKWKKRFNLLVKKKKVKFAFLLDVSNNEFFVDFLKNSKIITVGLISQNISFLKLDFWLVTNNNSYFIKYLFFSYIYSIYNIILSQKLNKFFFYYNQNFHRALSKLD
jgi:hypothetical protein